MVDLNTAMWITGLLTVGCVVIATVVMSLSGDIWDWGMALFVLFGVGLLLFIGGRPFARQTDNSEAF